MIYIGNAFSLQMVDMPCNISCCEVQPKDIPSDAVSCVGHADTACIVGGILGRKVECNRVSIHLFDGDSIYVAQIMGGRIPEGATTIPDGMSIKFIRVSKGDD